MMDKFYQGDKLVEEYSAYGNIEVNEMARVARIQPFIEQRMEVVVDSSVPDDMELDDIPPHLKYSFDLYFVNSPAIYPVKNMIQCVSPGQLQCYNGRAWEDIPYRQDWAEWETYIEEMEKINYPFVVLPTDDMHPRTWNLLEDSRMRLFKTLLNDNHKQVTLKEFEEKWIHLFNPEYQNNHELPIAAWLHISGTASSYVDVIEVNSDRTARVIFTVPPIMSLNQGETSIMDGKTPINIQNVVMRCRSESAVIPNSGEERFASTFNSAAGVPEELSKHAKMWKIIYDRYGWNFITETNNNVNDQTTVKANGKGSIIDDQMDDIVF